MPDKPPFEQPDSLLIQKSTVWKVVYNIALENTGAITRQSVQNVLGLDSIPPITLRCLRTFRNEKLIECVKAPDDFSVISNPSKESDFNQFILTSDGENRGSNYLVDPTKK